MVNEGIYKKCPKIFNFLKCFPATAKEKNKGEFVENTVNRFKNSNNFHILISPEGTLKKVPWRSGYYYLAKELKIPISVVGFNYITHKFDFVRFETIDENLEISETRLKKEFEKIIPLYPECSEVKIIINEKTKVFGYKNIKLNLVAFLTNILGNWFIYKICENIFVFLLISLCFSIWFS